jgi:hypothetical protein
MSAECPCNLFGGRSQQQFRTDAAQLLPHMVKVATGGGDAPSHQRNFGSRNIESIKPIADDKTNG